MRWFEEEMRNSVLTKTAAFYSQIKKPIVEELTPPIMSKEAAAGERKLQQLFYLLKQGQLDEEDLLRAAEVDPEIQSSLDYEQAVNENAALRQMNAEYQQQQGAIQQQMAMQQQQLQAAQQEQMMMGQQLQAERAGRQQAVEQAIQAKDMQLSTIVEQQQHRQQVMEAADGLAQQLKQVAATSPSEQQAMMQQQQQQAVAVQQQAAMAAMPKKVQKEVQQAQNAQAEAQEQTAEAEQQAAQEQAAAQQQPQGMAGPAPGMTVQASANPILQKLAKNVRVTDPFSAKEEELPKGYRIRPAAIVKDPNFFGRTESLDPKERMEQRKAEVKKKRKQTMLAGGIAGAGIGSTLGLAPAIAEINLRPGDLQKLEEKGLPVKNIGTRPVGSQHYYPPDVHTLEDVLRKHDINPRSARSFAIQKSVSPTRSLNKRLLRNLGIGSAIGLGAGLAVPYGISKFVESRIPKVERNRASELQNELIGKIEKQRVKKAKQDAKAAALAKTSASSSGCLQFMGLADAPVNKKTPEYGEKVTSTSHMYKEAAPSITPAMKKEIAEYAKYINKPMGNAPIFAALGLTTAGGAAAGALPYIRSGGGKRTLPDKKRLAAVHAAEAAFEDELDANKIPSAKSIHKLRKAELNLAESRRKQEDPLYGAAKGAFGGLTVGGLLAGTALKPGRNMIRQLVGAGKQSKEFRKLLGEEGITGIQKHLS